MKLLIITGSNRKQKVSYSMAMNILRKIKHLDRAVNGEIIELANVNLRSCCGSSKCTETKNVKCIYGDSDDFNYIFGKMQECECVLFIVPKYAPYPSKFLQFYERLVAIGWWGYVNRGRIEEFELYEKPVGLICFAHSINSESVFTPLMNSFESIGMSLLSFYKKEHGMFICRKDDNVDEMLQKVAEVVVARLHKNGRKEK